MGIRRTKEEKENVRHPFVLTWSSGSDVPSVKGQNTIALKAKSLRSNTIKMADESAQAAVASITKKGIVKSLILVSFILCLELVIYLAWK